MCNRVYARIATEIASVLVMVGVATTALSQQPEKRVALAEDQQSQLLMATVQSLLLNYRPQNDLLIRDIAARLNPQQRLRVYEAAKESAAIPFTVNIVAGFGVGSIMQGNIAGGVLSAAAQGIGGYLILTNINHQHTAGDTWIGFGLFLGGRIYDLVAPWLVAGERNSRFRLLLRPLSVAMVGSAPVIQYQIEF